MADSSVPITAGSGTPIRVLTALGAGNADQQVITLADQYGNLAPAAPDGTLQIDDGAASLAFETFDGTLANQWTTGGTAAPTQAAGALTFNTSTTASATSYITSINPIQLNANSYLQAGWVVQLDTTSTLTNNTRWWGYGQNAGSPTAAAPVTNGVVFLLDSTAGTFYAAVYSAGTRTQTVTLTKPTDGAYHRYQIYFRTSRAYYVQDGVTVATITYPNTAVSNGMFLIAGQANAGTSPASAPTLVASVASAADGGDNNIQLSDGAYPSVRATIKKGSVQAALTDTGLSVDLRQNGTTSVTGNLTALNQVVDGTTVLDGYATVRVNLYGTWVGTAIFETSYDQVTWSIKSLVSNTNSINVSSTSTGPWRGDIETRYFRVRCSAFTSGTINVAVQYTSASQTLPPALTTLATGSSTVGSIANITTSIIPGTAATNLGKAAAATPGTTDTGVASLYVRAPTTPVARTATAGNYSIAMVDQEGKQIIQQYADPANTWQVVLTQATTTAGLLKAAGAAGIRNYCTGITASNSSATATAVTVLDGATVIWEVWLPAGATQSMPFETPLRGTAATALNANLTVAATSVFISAQGFIGV